MPLIATKVAIPRRRGDILRRARLVDGIHQMIDRKLYLVVAPAGYGKTTLLVDFASDSEIPVCWYTLSPPDAEPAVFLRYVVAAIQARFPRFGSATLRVLAHADPRTDTMAVVGALINEVQERIPDYFTLILDDYHEVNEHDGINAIVDALLKLAPENLKLIVSSRTMPRLQLARLAATRQAAGVGATDLRFTVDEVRDLMREAYQTVLPDRVIEELTARSEGWITGIVLTTHTMWQGLFESMIRNAGQEQLYGYLANEVFERQPEAIQRFLLASSILDDMEPAIAGPLAGVARADDILRQLEESNLFVTELEGRRKVYRYHHLFRDFLRSRLDEQGHGLSRRDLERRAGLLYQKRGQHERALGHLLAAEDFDEAAQSILAVAQDTFDRGRLDALAGWLERVPEDVLQAYPRLSLWRVQTMIQQGLIEGAIGIAERLRMHAEQPGEKELAAECAVHLASALRLSGNHEQALDLCHAALAVFGEETSARRALALRTAGTAYWRLGQFEQARQCYEASHSLYERLQDGPAAAYLKNDLGAIAYFTGNLAEARRQFLMSARFWERAGNPGRQGLVLSNLGVLAQLEEDYAEALRLVQAGVEKGKAGLFPHTVVVAQCSLGDIYRDLGRFEEAGRCYEEALAVAEERGDRGELADVLMSMAQSYRAQDLPNKADVLLRRASRQTSGYKLAQSWMLRGICAIERGSFSRGETLLKEALDSFRASQARYLAARALFHLALAQWRLGKQRASDAHLHECVTILDELGYSQFLQVDAPRCLEFVRQAAARRIGEAFFEHVLRRLGKRAAPPLQRPELAQVAPERPHIAVRTLGATEISIDGRPVGAREWGTHTARELFVYLLLHRDGARRDRIMADIAPDATPARAISQFHVTAYRVRHALYKGCLRYQGDYYQVDPDLECDFDAEAFVRAMSLAEAAVNGSAEELHALQEAVDRYGGPFMDGFYSDWIIAERRSLEDRFLTACCRLGWLHVRAERWQEAIAAARRGLQADNSLAELHEIVLRGLLATDHASEAARHLQAYEAYLQDELGAEAPASLKRLVQPSGAGRQPVAVLS